MSEQKKFSVGPALLAFGIGGAFAGGCMAGLAYLMARQGLSQAAAWPMASAAVCAGSLLSGWAGGIFPAQQGIALRRNTRHPVRPAADHFWPLGRFFAHRDAASAVCPCVSVWLYGWYLRDAAH